MNLPFSIVRVYVIIHCLMIWIISLDPFFSPTFASSINNTSERTELNVIYYASSDSTDNDDNSPLVEFVSNQKDIWITDEKNKKTIPFGKRIVLSGTHNSQISDLSIRLIYGDKDEVLDAKVSNQSWYAVVGPFPVNEDVILLFDIKSYVTNSMRQELISDFEKSFDRFRDDLFDTGLDVERSALRDVLNPILNRNLPDYFENYLTPENETLKNLISDFLLSQDLEALEELIGTQENIKSQQGSLDGIKDEIIKLIEQNNVRNLYEEQKPFEGDVYDSDIKIIEDVLNKNDVLNKADNRIRLPDIINSLETLDDNFKENISTLIADYDTSSAKKDSLQSSKTMQLEEIYQATIEKIENTRLYSAINLKSSLQVSDIEHYAGFDISENYLFNGNSVSTLFTVNIYFKRVDYNQPPKTFLDHLSLTAGLGITTPNINSNGPVYFIGAGVRLNKIFRINSGYAFYNSSEEGKYTGNFTSGLSINFRFIADLFEIFNGSTSNF